MKNSKIQHQNNRGSESIFPIPRVLDFLRTVSPFDILDNDELARQALQMEIAFFPRGQRISEENDPALQNLYVIWKGAVRVSVVDHQGKELLEDIRGEGDCFGTSAFLENEKISFKIFSLEDLVVFVLPSEKLQQLVAGYPVFKRFFSLSLAASLQAIRHSDNFQWPQPIGLNAINLDAFVTGKRVSELMSKNVLTCSPDVSIRTAARLMAEKRVSSIVVTGSGQSSLGIVTDNDLRTKVIAAGLSPEAAVSEIMSRPMRTITPDTYVFDALLKMSQFGVRLLGVVEADRIVGIISEHDLQTEMGGSPIQVINEIQRSASLDALIGMRPKIDRLLEMLLRQGGPVNQLVAMVTELNDRLTLRILELTEQQMAQEGLGEPPTPYSWIAFGSEGRMEQTLHTDQDNALFFSLPSPGDGNHSKTWFLNFSERVVDCLVRSGIPRCPGGVMASNPQWCNAEDWWQDQFLKWITTPDPQTLLMAAIFFDFRPIYSGTDFPSVLQDRLFGAIRKNRLFLRFMAKISLNNRPPLGLLKRFVVEKSGEHKNKLDLKIRGLTPIVDAARVLSLELGIKKQNTLDRLAEIKQRGVIDTGFYADLCEAYEFIVYLQISQHLDAISRQEEPDNFIDPKNLNSLQRKMLRESFAIINHLQEILEFRFHTSVMEI
jgi:CBS domain-containing protein